MQLRKKLVRGIRHQQYKWDGIEFNHKGRQYQINVLTDPPDVDRMYFGWVFTRPTHWNAFIDDVIAKIESGEIKGTKRGEHEIATGYENCPFDYFVPDTQRYIDVTAWAKDIMALPPGTLVNQSAGVSISMEFTFHDFKL